MIFITNKTIDMLQNNLDQLKEKAEKYGFDLIDGEFVKRTKDNERVVVMEIMLNSKSMYEDFGRFKLTHGFFDISFMDKNFLNVRNSENLFDLIDEYPSFFREQKFDRLFDLLDRYDIDGENVFAFYYDDDLIEGYKDYCPSLVSLSEMTLSHESYDFYLSIFEIDKEILLNNSNVNLNKVTDININKLITDN